MMAVALALGGSDLVAEGNLPLELGKTGARLRVSRPMEVVVLNCWVTETKETSWAPNNSTSFAKSAVPIHSYNRSARWSRLGSMRKSLADDIRCSANAARSYRSCQVPDSGPIVAIVDDDEAVGNAIEVLMRSIGLVARAFSSGGRRSCALPN